MFFQPCGFLKVISPADGVKNQRFVEWMRRGTKGTTGRGFVGWMVSWGKNRRLKLGIFWGRPAALPGLLKRVGQLDVPSLRGMWMRVAVDAVVGLKFFLPRNHWRKGRASYWKLAWGPLCIWVPNLYWFELILLETDTGWWLFQISSFKYPCREEACWGTQCWVTNCQKIWTGLAIIPSFLGYDKPECFGRRLSAHQSMSQWDEVKNTLWQSLGVERVGWTPFFFPCFLVGFPTGFPVFSEVPFSSMRVYVVCWL